jgi:HEPN domain-containing protein
MRPESRQEAHEWLVRRPFLYPRVESAPRTHNLVRLVDRCQVFDEGFSRFLESAQTLTPYAVRFRYPGGLLEPQLSEAEYALALAREILSYVRSCIEGS